MVDLLKDYAKEIHGEGGYISLHSLISSHRHLRNANIENLKKYDAIRKEVREKAEASTDSWLKCGEYIHRDKLLSMTIQEIVDFLR